MEVPAVVNDPSLLYPSLPLTPSPAQPPLTHCKSNVEAPLELGDLSKHTESGYLFIHRLTGLF